VTPRKIVILERESPEDLGVYVEALARTCPGLAVAVAMTSDAAIAEAADATAIWAKAHDVSAQLVAAMPKLDWVQALTSGTDALRRVGLGAGVRVTSARGSHAPQMAELGLLLMLALARDLPRMLRNQHDAIWERRPQRLLYDRTIGIVGVGAIGEALAGYCRTFGMRVLGVSDTRSAAPGFDALEPRSRLGEVAAAADFLLILAPYEARTHHLIDAAVLARMRPEAYLINLARGPLVDEAALIEALRAGRIAGAGLDVFEVEPPAADNPLWQMQNVIMTPHVGGLSDIYVRQLLPLLLHNAEAYAAGDFDAMRNRV
jgi:phosphoglycerate dehydrogenase-like enzyme